MDACQALTKHLDEVVAGLHLGLLHQTEQEGAAFRFTQLLNPRHIQDAGLCGELAEFGLGQSRQQRGRVAQRDQPVVVVKEFLEMRESRTFRWLFQCIERRAACLGVAFQQGGKLLPQVGRDLVRDLLAEPLIDLGAHMTSHAVERAEGRQFAGLLEQFVNRHIDQIGGHVHHRCGAMDGFQGDTARPCIRRSHAEMVSHRCLMALVHAILVIPKGYIGGKARCLSNVVDHGERNGRQGRKMPQVLKHLEQHEQAELVLRDVRFAVGKEPLVMRGGVGRLQVVVSEALRKARIGGAMGCGHCTPRRSTSLGRIWSRLIWV